MSGDLISRQAAIDRINKQREHLNPALFEQDNIGDMAYRICAEFIGRLPSAERHGRWIDNKRMGFDGTFHWFRQCSECLYEREDDTPEKDTNYCPNCGASMKGE